NLSITMSTASSVSGFPHTGQNSAFVQTTSSPTTTEKPRSSKREHSQFSGFLPSLLHQEHPLHAFSTCSLVGPFKAEMAALIKSRTVEYTAQFPYPQGVLWSSDSSPAFWEIA